MGKTWQDFVPMGNGYPYPENIWVGHGYEIAPMGNPMGTQKILINENNSYDMWGLHPTHIAQLLIPYSLNERFSTLHNSASNYLWGFTKGQNLHQSYTPNDAT